MDRTVRSVHLTFDDGPVPDITPWVLDQLALHNAKATFFCIGKNAKANALILNRIQDEGHAIGNHTYDHLRGSTTPTETYVENVVRTEDVLDLSAHPGKTMLFRPPYGRITNEQVRALKDRYRIIMWDVLSGDFDIRLSGEQCLKNVIDHVRPGSIVVFHDSVKAEDRLRYALPRTLEYLKNEGYAMKALD